MKFKHSLRPTYAYKWVSSFRIIGGKNQGIKWHVREKKTFDAPTIRAQKSKGSLRNADANFQRPAWSVGEDLSGWSLISDITCFGAGLVRSTSYPSYVTC